MAGKYDSEIALLRTQLQTLAALEFSANVTTEEEAVDFGAEKVRLIDQITKLEELNIKTRKPFRVTYTHPRG